MNELWHHSSWGWLEAPPEESYISYVDALRVSHGIAWIVGWLR